MQPFQKSIHDPLATKSRPECCQFRQVGIRKRDKSIPVTQEYLKTRLGWIRAPWVADVCFQDVPMRFILAEIGVWSADENGSCHPVDVLRY